MLSHPKITPASVLYIPLGYVGDDGQDISPWKLNYISSFISKKSETKKKCRTFLSVIISINWVKKKKKNAKQSKYLEFI